MGKRSCDSCKNASTSPTCYPCCDCDSDSNKYEPQINADRIRNLSDKELAEYLKLIQEHTIKSQQVDSMEDMLEWLQAEVKEGNSNENT